MNTVLPFTNRLQAGRLLGEAVRSELQPPDDALILGLVRGGAVVAAASSSTAGLAWDVLVVRKIGAPQQPEYAVGAYAESGTYMLNEGELRHLRVTPGWRDEALHRAALDCETLQSELRVGSSALRLSGRCVILTDDGMATGLTMLTAIAAAKRAGASEVCVAVPVMAHTGPGLLRSAAVRFTSLACPDDFQAVGQFYVDFHPVSSEEVRALLAARQS